MTLKVVQHPKKSRKAMIVCDKCDILVTNSNDAFDVIAANKPSHRLLICKKGKDDRG